MVTYIVIKVNRILYWNYRAIGNEYAL